MEIKMTTKDVSKQDLYFLTKSPKAKKMRDAVGQRLEIAAAAVYEDTNNKTGELMTIVSIKTVEKDIFVTNSGPFCREFLDLVEIFGIDEIPAIDVLEGTSRSGRNYITCTLAE